MPGQAVTIGRAPTNQIVIKDERCSRAHAEVFYSQGHWVVRDLESRNGTTIGGANVRGDHVLEAGEIIRIGQSQMAFVHDLTKAFPDSSAVFKDLKVRAAAGDETTLNTRQLQYARWFNALKAAVGRSWHPAQVQETTHHVLDPVSRVTVVRFTLDRAGGVKDVALEKSCGFAPYDEEAARAVRLAGTIPDPPDFLFDGRDRFLFHFTFRVDEYWPKPRR